MATLGGASALGENSSASVSSFARALAVYRSSGATVGAVGPQSCLGRAHAKLGQFDEARHCNGEAMTLGG